MYFFFSLFQQVQIVRNQKRNPEMELHAEAKHVELLLLKSPPVWNNQLTKVRDYANEAFTVRNDLILV